MFEGLFQPMHLLVILLICLLVFGPRRLPELGKGLGEGIRGFRDAMKDGGNQAAGGSNQAANDASKDQNKEAKS